MVDWLYGVVADRVVQGRPGMNVHGREANVTTGLVGLAIISTAIVGHLPEGAYSLA